MSNVWDLGLYEGFITIADLGCLISEVLKIKFYFRNPKSDIRDD